jgi:hypothetical protein
MPVTMKMRSMTQVVVDVSVTTNASPDVPTTKDTF